MRDDLTQARLKELLSYDPETGIFTWLVSRRGQVRIGSIAGTLNSDGYWALRFDGKIYGAHRLAWLYVTGEWPSHQVDHEDMDRRNNRWSNLRLATGSQNKANMGKHLDNTSGFKGVRWNKQRKNWIARITVCGRDIYLGSFHDPQEAHEAYARAAIEHFGEFARAQ